jgi:hypothetical protein
LPAKHRGIHTDPEAIASWVDVPSTALATELRKGLNTRCLREITAVLGKTTDALHETQKHEIAGSLR